MRVQASKYKVTACMHKHPNKIGMRAQHLLNKATLLGITFLKLLWWLADDRTHARLVRTCVIAGVRIDCWSRSHTHA
jgi:hypothetical protein